MQPKQEKGPRDPEGTVYSCKICNYKTNYKAHLKTHETSKHSGQTFNCDQCDFRTAWKQGEFDLNSSFHFVAQLALIALLGF